MIGMLCGLETDYGIVYEYHLRMMNGQASSCLVHGSRMECVFLKNHLINDVLRYTLVSFFVNALKITSSFIDISLIK